MPVLIVSWSGERGPRYPTVVGEGVESTYRHHVRSVEGNKERTEVRTQDRESGSRPPAWAPRTLARRRAGQAGRGKERPLPDAAELEY